MEEVPKRGFFADHMDLSARSAAEEEQKGRDLLNGMRCCIIRGKVLDLLPRNENE
jgi:hypothetical protein